MKRKLILTDKNEDQLFEGAKLSTDENLQELFGRSNFGRILKNNGITKIELVILNNYPNTLLEYQIRIIDSNELLPENGIVKDEQGFYFKCGDETFLNYIASHLVINNKEDNQDALDWNKSVIIIGEKQYTIDPMEFVLGENAYLDELFRNRLNWKFDDLVKKEDIEKIVVVFELYSPYCIPHIGFKFKRNNILLKNKDVYYSDENGVGDILWSNEDYCLKILQGNELELSLFLNSLKS